MSGDIRNYPRVLVVLREGFNNQTGNGITINNLFRDWPKENLATVYWDETDLDTTVCNCHYEMSDSEVTYHFPFNQLTKGQTARVRLPRAVTTQGGDTVAKAEMEPRPSAGAKAILRSAYRMLPFVRPLWQRFMKSLGSPNQTRTMKVSSHLARWVQEFQPEVIYTVPTHLAAIQFTNRLARMTGASVVLHVYDDWPTLLNAPGWINKFYAPYTRRKLRLLMHEAAVRMCIGQDMCEEYERRYGLPFESFQNCPDADLWRAQARTVYHKEKIFVFRFLGAIYEGGNLNGLLTFATAIERLHESGYPARLEIYTPDLIITRFEKAFAPFQQTCLYSAPDETSEVARLHGTAHGLILAIDFDSPGREKLRFSMPTKLPSYMLSGTPILAYAPPNTSIVRLLKETGSGYILEEPLDALTLANYLRAFCDDEYLRRQLAERALLVAQQSLTAEVVRPRFAEALRRARDRKKGCG